MTKIEKKKEAPKLEWTQLRPNYYYCWTDHGFYFVLRQYKDACGGRGRGWLWGCRRDLKEFSLASPPIVTHYNLADFNSSAESARSDAEADMRLSAAALKAEREEEEYEV